MKFILLPVIIASLLILVGGYFVIRNIQLPEPPPPPVPVHPPPPAPAAVPPPPAEPAPAPQPTSLEDQVTGFRQAVAEVAATGESREVILTFTEAEMTEQANRVMTRMEIPADIPLEIRGATIDLQPGNNMLTVADTTILGFDASLKVNTGVGIRDGRPDISVNDISFGMIPVPGAVKEKITALISQQTDRMLVALTEAETGGVDLEFIDMTTDEDTLSITVLVSKTE